MFLLVGLVNATLTTDLYAYYSFDQYNATHLLDGHNNYDGLRFSIVWFSIFYLTKYLSFSVIIYFFLYHYFLRKL